MDSLEEKLIKGKWVSPLALIEAQHHAERTGKSLFCSLIKLGHISEEDVFRFFAVNSNIPFIKVSQYRIKDEVLTLLDENFCRENLVIPLFKIDSALFVAMVNPLDAQLIANISTSTKLDIHPLLASPTDIERALNNYWGYPDSFFSVERLVFKHEKLSSFPLYRAKERIPLDIPINFKIDDSNVQLANDGYISGSTFDVSEDISALGIKTSIFLPKGARLTLYFLHNEKLKIKGEVVYCRLEGKGYFSLGVRLLDLKSEDISYIKRLSKPLT